MITHNCRAVYREAGVCGVRLISRKRVLSFYYLGLKEIREQFPERGLA